MVVRASPVLYRLRDATPPAGRHNGAFQLGYRMFIAVATLDSVLVYDTQHPTPVAVISSFHCDKITDVAWCVAELTARTRAHARA